MTWMASKLGGLNIKEWLQPRASGCRSARPAAEKIPGCPGRAPSSPFSSTAPCTARPALDAGFGLAGTRTKSRENPFRRWRSTPRLRHAGRSCPPAPALRAVFAARRSWRYERRYPFFIAPTSSRASPTLFRLLRPRPRLADLCRLLPVLAESGAFPTLSLRALAWMSGPLPRWDMECFCSLLPPYRRPSPAGNGSASHKVPPDDFLVGALYAEMAQCWRAGGGETNPCGRRDAAGWKCLAAAG